MGRGTARKKEPAGAAAVPSAVDLPESKEKHTVTGERKQGKRKRGDEVECVEAPLRRSLRGKSQPQECQTHGVTGEKRRRLASSVDPEAATETKVASARKKSSIEEESSKGSSAKFPNLQKERRLAAKGWKAVVGVDEAGRGPLAGPVVAAAALLPADATDDFLGVDDSKRLSENDREEIFEKLMAHPGVVTAVSIIDHKTIDDINILASAMKAMANAVGSLPVPADFALIDGNRSPEGLTVPGELVIKGDAKCTSIAAASIVAKVTRDRLMREYHDKWPQYNFAKHKGYGTAEHVRAIHEHGPSPIHRMTFAPLKTLFPAKAATA